MPDLPKSAREMLERGKGFLRDRGHEEWRLEAELLVAHALGLDRMGLFLALERPLEETEVARGRELLSRRARGEPVAYLVGEREFYGRGFEVGPGVLVPRPETELLVDLARAHVRERLYPAGGPSILDLGTGSGCLAVTLALEIEGARVEAIDASSEALAYAMRNAARLGADVAFHEDDGFAPFAGREALFDLIVSNPPYVRPDERDDLPTDVREHEPASALFAPEGEPDHWVGRVVREGLALLKDGGVALVELGHDQAPRVAEKLRARDLRFRLHEDLAGIERVLELEKPG